MATDLDLIVQHDIRVGPQWPINLRSCTNAVVCWLWCLHHDARQALSADPNRTVDNGIANGMNGNFQQFLIGAGWAKMRNTTVFLKKMANAVGSRSRVMTTFSLRRGSVVIWLPDSGVGHCSHAGVNGGGNVIYGYNQGGDFFKPNCSGARHAHGPHARCARRAEHISWHGYKLHIVRPQAALQYFAQNHNTPGVW